MVKDRMQFDRRVVESCKDECAVCVHEKTGYLDCCIGFIDGTVRPTCHPKHHLRQVYNRHKRVHALKYQLVVLANEMIMSLTGPVEGRRHDIALLRASNFGPSMARDFPDCYVYGDPAYSLASWIIRPFRDRQISQQQQQFNSSMSSARVCVEWVFGDIVKQWVFLDFKKNLKIFLLPVGKLYIVAGFLTNCRTCVKGESQTSKAFDCSVPELEEYLADD